MLTTHLQTLVGKAGTIGSWSIETSVKVSKIWQRAIDEKYTVTPQFSPPHFSFSQFSVFQTMDTPRNFRSINLAIFAFFSLREKKQKKL